LGRECNLACHTCKPLLSSTWEKEVKKLGWTQELVDLNWKSQDFDFKTRSFSLAGYENLKEIKFVGGETLINDRHLEILNTIPSQTRKNIIVDYYTNGTIPFKDSYYNTWKHFKQVKVRFSIDGHKELNEYIRYPSKWNVIESNIKDCLSTYRENVHFRLHTTVSILNIFSLNKISEWWDEISKNSPCSTEEVKFNLLHDPSFLSIATLKQLTTSYDKLVQSEKWLSFIEHSVIEEKHLKLLKHFLNNLDQQRGNSLKGVIPDLSDILF
jgi:sulfatase maturation enzyme AslB (radical SAM superfamily)